MNSPIAVARVVALGGLAGARAERARARTRAPPRPGRPSSGSAGRSWPCRRRPARRRRRRSRRGRRGRTPRAPPRGSARGCAARRRGGAGISTTIRRTPGPPRRPRRRSTRRGGARSRATITTAPREHQPGADEERQLEAARRARRRASRACDAARPGRRDRREDRETERAADLLRRVEQPRGETGVGGVDVRRRDQRHRHERQPHPDRHRHQAREADRPDSVPCAGIRLSRIEPERGQQRCPTTGTARGADALDQRLGEPGADHDPEGHRHERDAGLERAVVEDLLHVDRGEVEHPEQPRDDEEHRHVGARQRAAAGRCRAGSAAPSNGSRSRRTRRAARRRRRTGRACGRTSSRTAAP